MAGTTTHADSPLTIGEIARRAGCHVETIRYYERIGVLPAPPRTVGGHRLYGRQHRRRLLFIRRSRELGFDLGAIGRLLDLVDGGNQTCATVRSLTLQHVDQVRRRIADLQKTERALKSMAVRCAGGQVPECPVIDVLFDDAR